MSGEGRPLTQEEVDSATARNILITEDCRVFVVTNSERNKGKEYIGKLPNKSWLAWVDSPKKRTLEEVYLQNEKILAVLAGFEAK